MIDFKQLRIPWNLPSYPPYHTGKYIEEYFYDYYIQNKSTFDQTGYTLLPIFWTTAYLNRLDVAPYINILPKNLKYFCVAQHDDGVKEPLPPDTIVFSAGGNSGGIPLPLVCSPIPESYIQTNEPQTIFCSFVGSNTHPVRQQMIDALKDDSLFYIQTDDWSWNINQTKQEMFFNTIKKSKYTLCPRGYGAQSFRFYEALQLGSVPIYIHDDRKWQPYAEKLNWNEFSVSIHISEIDSLKDKLLSITDLDYQKMVSAGKRVYEDFFHIRHIPEYVLNTLTTIHHVDWDQLIEELVRKNHKPGWNYCDVGSCQGQFTRQFVELCNREGYVYAFDINPNNPLIQGCINERLAISDTNSIEKVYGGENNHMFSILEQDVVQNSNPFICEVPSTTLDDYFRNKPLDCIKIDIEGAEVKAIKGGLETLKKCSLIIIECHLDEQWEEIYDLLTGAGLRFRELSTKQKITRKVLDGPRGIRPYQIYCENY